MSTLNIEKWSLNLLIWNVWSWKSHFIEKNNLKDFVVSPDEIRKIYFPELEYIWENWEKFYWSFYADKDNQVWNIVKNIVIDRLLEWLTVFIDATFTNTNTRVNFLFSILKWLQEKWQKEIIKNLDINYLVFNNTKENSLNNIKKRFKNWWHFIADNVVIEKQNQLNKFLEKVWNKKEIIDNEDLFKIFNKKQNVFLIYKDSNKQEYNYDNVQIVLSEKNILKIDALKNNWINNIVILPNFKWNFDVLSWILKWSSDKNLNLKKDKYFIFNWWLFNLEPDELLNNLKLFYKILKKNKQWLYIHDKNSRYLLKNIEEYIKYLKWQLTKEEELQFNNSISALHQIFFSNLWTDLEKVKSIYSLLKDVIKFSTDYLVFSANNWKLKEKFLISNNQIITDNIENLPYSLIYTKHNWIYLWEELEKRRYYNITNWKISLQSIEYSKKYKLFINKIKFNNDFNMWVVNYTCIDLNKNKIWIKNLTLEWNINLSEYDKKIKEKLSLNNIFFKLIKSKNIRKDKSWNNIIFSYKSWFFSMSYKLPQIFKKKIKNNSIKFLKWNLDEIELKHDILEFINKEKVQNIKEEFIEKYIKEIKKYKNKEKWIEKFEENFWKFDFIKFITPSIFWWIEKLARWIAINELTKEIVVRWFDKFFNLHNWEIWELNLLKDFESKIKFSNKKEELTLLLEEKINWYLWLLSFDKEKNDFLFATKWTLDKWNSEINSKYIEFFKELFNKQFNKNKTLKEELLNYIKENNITLIFEVVHKDDPHVIQYNEWLYLLDILKNKIKQETIDISEKEKISEKYWFKKFQRGIITIEVEQTEKYKFFENFIEFLKDKVEMWKNKKWKFVITLADIKKITLENVLEKDYQKELMILNIEKSEWIVIKLLQWNIITNIYKNKFWFYLFKKMIRSYWMNEMLKYKTFEEYIDNVSFDEDEYQILKTVFNEIKNKWEILTEKELLELI